MIHCASLLLPLILALVVDGGWLGIFLADTDRPTIAEVVPGSPAAAADLQPGDVILSLAGEAVHSVEAFAARMEKLPAGRLIELQLQRGDQRIKLELRLVERPGQGVRAGTVPGRR